MTDYSKRAAVRRAVFSAAVSIAALAIPSFASAQSGPEMSEESPAIVVNNNLNPNAPGVGGALDTGVNGVGQMVTIVQNAPGGGAGLSLCTGTLINPRAVIFAAHCVNSRPASAYGSETGKSGGISGISLPSSTGTPISFGFSATNRCLGVASNGCASGTGPYERWRDSGYRSQVGSNIFNVNQIWYDTRSLEPAAVGFLYGDVAIATLDTPATEVPTWTMLFSPLTGETHATITGYGVNGTSASGQGGVACVRSASDVCRPLGSIDYRRRVAENMISALISLDEQDLFLFGESGGRNPQALYETDFDSPAGQDAYNPGALRYDFDLFNGAALPREGTTAGGDSGGPLVVDQKYSKPVTVGVLSGGSRFFNGQRFSTYGTTSFYQPLFLYWEDIVANNPYAYVSSKAGNANWFDPTHWVQDMDPNYAIDVNGRLTNALPNFRQDANNGNGPRFGTICFLDICEDITGTALPTVASPIIVPGGPGSTNFVPNNVAPVNSVTPGQTVKARYYDVTLAQSGTTTLDRAATIDQLSVKGSAILTVASAGNLTVLGDYTQTGGNVNLNGLLKTGEAFIGTGLLAGRGTFDPTFLTVLGGTIAPGGLGGFGTLTIKGDVILTSATLTQFDVNRDAADKLVVMGDAQNPGIISLGGIANFVKPSGAAPRHGQTYEIITATGGVQGTFNSVAGKQGVLRPVLTYGANNVVVTLHADSLASNSGKNPAAQAFATALDGMRGLYYDNLYGLYGAIDVMETAQLTQTLAGLAPGVTGLAQVETGQQKSLVLGLVNDRLSMLGTNRASGGSFTLLGAPETLGLAVGQTDLSASSASQLSFARSLSSNGRGYGNLPENVSGFLSGGYEFGRPGATDAGNGGQRSTWHIAMGLEMEAAENLTLGTAFGYVNGRSNIFGTQAETRTSQGIAYGAYRLSNKAYVAGMASVTHTDIGVDRSASNGIDAFNLNGDTSALSYDLHVETGANLKLAKGLTLTPRAGVRYAATDISGYRERGGEIALLVDELKERRLEGRLGARMSGTTAVGKTGWSFSPELSVDRVQTLSGSNSDLTVRFASASGIPIVLDGFSSDRAWTEVKGGLKFGNARYSFGAAVESSMGRSDYRDDRAVADFTIRF